MGESWYASFHPIRVLPIFSPDSGSVGQKLFVPNFWAISDRAGLRFLENNPKMTNFWYFTRKRAGMLVSTLLECYQIFHRIRVQWVTYYLFPTFGRFLTVPAWDFWVWSSSQPPYTWDIGTSPRIGVTVNNTKSGYIFLACWYNFVFW